jgi:hypothetical protein
MKKMRTLITAMIVGLSFMYGCGDGNDNNNSVNDNLPKKENIPDSSKVYSLKAAVDSQYITVEGEGMGTYRQIKVNMVNQTNYPIKIDVPAGLFFINPDSSAQSLITAISLSVITLQPKEAVTHIIPSYCTNASQHSPGILKGWKFSHNYNGGLDEAIAFYGEYQSGIDAWLQKKNPEKFDTEEKRRLFFQVVIWYHEGGSYAQISELLSKDVFGNDILKAKQWLEEIDKEAQELAKIIKYKNIDEIKKWIKDRLSDLFKNNGAIQKGKDRLNDLMQNLN